jgi:hypothetical protein
VLEAVTRDDALGDLDCSFETERTDLALRHGSDLDCEGKLAVVPTEDGLVVSIRGRGGAHRVDVGADPRLDPSQSDRLKLVFSQELLLRFARLAVDSMHCQP